MVSPRRHAAWPGPVWTDDTETDVALEPVDDEATRAAVGSAYEQKYAGQGSALRTMLEPPAALTTTRLVLTR